jgi:hypothetical protein
MKSWFFWLGIVATQLEIGSSSYISLVVRMESTMNQRGCLVGAYCAHAVLTDRIGVYRCPFGECFKKLESRRRGGFLDD